MNFSAFIFLFLFAACHEDLSGKRFLEAPQEETETPQGEDPQTIRVRCFAQDEIELLYLIRARNTKRDVANCTGTRETESCETKRTDLKVTTTGEGNEQRGCLTEKLNPTAFSICLSTRSDPPDTAGLVRMEGHEFGTVFDFVCEESIFKILR